MPAPDIDVIVLGLSATGLYAVREAAQFGLRVLGIGAPGAPGLWSRHLSGRVCRADAAARVQALVERFDPGSKRKPVLIVTSDQDLDAVIAGGCAVSRRVHMQGSYTDGMAARLMDKAELYRLCAAQNVAFPQAWTADAGRIATLRDEIRFPCMIKPARIHDVKHLMAGRKGWVLRNRDEFDRIAPEIPPAAGTVIAQEIVPGAESEISLWCGYVDHAGNVTHRFTARKLRQYPPGFGSASMTQSHVESECAEIAERFLTRIGFRGIAAAEFKRDPRTGALRLIEINPRPSLWFSNATASGVCLIGATHADLTGRKAAPAVAQRNGIRWRYGMKDCAAGVFYRRQPDFILPRPDLGAVGPPLGRAQAVASWDDPAPVFAEAAGYLRKIGARLGRLRP